MKKVNAKHIKQDMKEESEIIKAAKQMKKEDIKVIKGKSGRKK